MTISELIKFTNLSISPHNLNFLSLSWGLVNIIMLGVQLISFNGTFGISTNDQKFINNKDLHIKKHTVVIYPFHFKIQF